VPQSPVPTTKKLTDYPRPSVAVDVAVLTVRDDALQVVVVRHDLGGLALPGTFLHAGERLSDAAARALRDKATLSDVTFAQLRVFDDPARDERGWVLSVGHSGALASDRIPEPIDLMPVVDGRPVRPLLFDHADIVALAVEELRLRYGRELDPANLLDETFTVLELRRIYQAVFDRQLVKDTFRRYVIDALEPTGERATAFGRPAELFRRRPGATLPPSAWAFFVAGGR
jgi:8-oxo-dGTP diphosphatase